MELSKRNSIRLTPLIAPRGNIYDRNGKLLAGSRIAFDCAAIPQEFKVDEKRLQQLSAMLETPVSSLKKKIKENRFAPFAPVILKKNIGRETAIAISEQSEYYPGLIIQTYPARDYPNGNVACHVTGYLGKIGEEELSSFRDYGFKPLDYVGRGGLELYYNSYLRGENGGMQTEVDSRGRELRVLGIKEPEKGRDITVTIDLELEKYIASLMEGYKGAVLVMDASSGEVLGLVSKPDFDPNVLVSSSDPATIKKLLRRSDYPLVNRAVSGTYPPGSVFKIVTSSAAIECKNITPSERLDCQGFYILGTRRFDCWKSTGHGSQTMTDGIKNSCNVFFYQVGRRVGIEKLFNFAVRYGFGTKSGIDLPYEADGIVPNGIWKKRCKKEAWYDGDTINFAIGQGYLVVTPVQILGMMNALATEGELIRPFLVKKIDNTEISGIVKKELDISKNTFSVIKTGTIKAVRDENGTAKHAGVPGLDIAGKTGTAEVDERGTHAWFAGYCPTDKPKVSLVVFLEYGGKGGDKPCQIAAKIFEKLRELKYI